MSFTFILPSELAYRWQLDEADGAGGGTDLGLNILDRISLNF
jgi:hypothetical protein